jgi:hypothetical protein
MLMHGYLLLVEVGTYGSCYDGTSPKETTHVRLTSIPWSEPNEASVPFDPGTGASS